jgi:hypothetical protein
LAPFAKIGADRQAIFEILSADPAAMELINIPVLVAYQAAQVGFRPAAVKVGFAPVSADTSPNSTIFSSICRHSLDPPRVHHYSMSHPHSKPWQHTNGLASGNLTFTAPQQPGQYEFRYFLNGGYQLAARSLPVTVIAPAQPTRSLTTNPSTVSIGGSFVANWAAPAGSSPTDWIGLFRIGAPNSPSIAWRFTGGTTTGGVTFTAPNQPGQYELRYFLNNTYALVLKSDPITVSAGPVAPASYSLMVSTTVQPASSPETL